MRKIRIALLVSLLLLAPALRGIDIADRYIRDFDVAELRQTEGIWLWNSGALVSIKADEYGGFDMLLIESPDPDIDVPVPIGRGHFAGGDGKYELELFSKDALVNKKPMKAKLKFTANFSDKGRLQLVPKNKYSIDAWRIIPYLFRLSIRRNGNGDATETAIRVWPSNGSPEIPVVL